LDSQKDREIFELRASKENLSKRGLEVLLRDKKKRKAVAQFPQVKAGKKLKPTRGRLYAYRLFKAEYSEKWLVDCGFNVFKETEFKPETEGIFLSQKKEGAFHFIPSTIKKRDLFTNKAHVQKILDGDTIWVSLDVGFGIWLKQKVRLRGINTAPIETDLGKKAFQYVKTALKDLPFVVLKSHGRDKFDRYLVDLFYLHGSVEPQEILDEGAYLNSKLIEVGLAKLYKR